MDLEEIWRIREEGVYPELFGTNCRGIFPLTGGLFTGQFQQTAIDPRWLFYGILEFAPMNARPCWLYVTSGLSNRWDWDEEAEPREANGMSGNGVEFLFASTQQGGWAIRYLQSMLAFDILLSANRFPGREPLRPGDRIPLRSPIDGNVTCVLQNAIVSAAESFPPGFVLPSGRVDFLTFTGVADDEISFAKANGTPMLIETPTSGRCLSGY